MKPRTWVMALVIVLPISGVVRAAEKPKPAAAPPVQGERPGLQMLERIRFSLGELKLSDEQKTKVDAIFRNARLGLESLRTEVQALEPQERMERVGEFFRDVRNELAAVMNDEQRAKLDEKLMEARQAMRGKFAGATTTAPAPRDGAMRPGEMLERLRDAVTKLDLTVGQKEQIRSLVDEAQGKGEALREEMRAGGQNVREKGRQLLEESRRKVDAILTPAQQQKLGELMAAPATRPATQAMMMEDGGDMMMRGGERRSAAKKTGDGLTANGDPSKAPVGSVAPAFALRKLDGSLVQLTSLKGRVIVLVFGSWTCPAFRDRAAMLEKLKSSYSTGVQFFVIYTREAHAKDEWEVARNKNLEISVEQPKTMDARTALAKKSRDELKLTVPILLDTLGNETASAYGAGANSAFVINRDARISARQQWFDAAGLRRAIDEAAKATPSTKPAS
jgi:Spy/CpxP family protein refolding chaperone/peroxiredoxin